MFLYIWRTPRTTAQHDWLHHTIPHYNTIQCNIPQHNTTQHNILQYNTLHHQAPSPSSHPQHSTRHCRTTQHDTPLHTLQYTFLGYIKTLDPIFHVRFDNQNTLSNLRVYNTSNSADIHYFKILDKEVKSCMTHTSKFYCYSKQFLYNKQ